MPGSDRHRDNGFTLVEVLVALVISALLLTIVMEAAVTARARDADANRSTNAIELTRALITRAKAAPLAEGAIERSYGKLHSRVNERVLALGPRRLFALVRIDVVVNDERGRPLYSAAARKLKPATPQ